MPQSCLFGDAFIRTHIYLCTHILTSASAVCCGAVGDIGSCSDDDLKQLFSKIAPVLCIRRPTPAVTGMCCAVLVFACRCMSRA